MRNKGEEFERQLICGALTQRDLALIKLMFFSPEDADLTRTVFEDLDMESESRFFRVMLSVFGKENDWFGFPQERLSRFQGIWRHFQEENEQRFLWLSGILNMLERAGIPAMLVKGGAMFAYYRKGSPRVMDDFDVAVPGERFDQAVSIIKKADCEHLGSASWSETFLGRAGEKSYGIDLHRRVFKNAESADKEVWERAVYTEFMGTGFYVPSPQDMCLHQLDTQIRNCFYGEHPDRRIKWMVDWCVMRAGYPQETAPSHLKELSKRFFNTHYIHLALRILSYWLPETLSYEEVEKSFPSDKAYHDWLARGAAYHGSFEKAAISYREGSPTVLRHFRLLARRWKDEYRFMGPEIMAQKGKMSLLKYYMDQTGNPNMRELVKRYRGVQERKTGKQKE